MTRPLPPQKKSSNDVRLYTFPDSAGFARQLARAIGLALKNLRVHSFPDGESLIRVQPPVSDTAVLVRSLHDPNAKLVETLLAADALRRAHARRVILIAPYLPYMRQDTMFHPGEPISQRVIGALLGQTFDGVLTLEAHLHRIQHLGEVMSCQAQSLSAAPVLAAWVRRAGSRCLIVGPDEESEPWVHAIGREAGAKWIVGKKERSGDRRVRIRFPELPSSTRAVLVDDIASSGGTLAEAARVLHRAGISTIDALVVHAIFAPGALRRMRTAGIRHVLSCDTISHPTNALRSAPLMATALQEMLL
ncbi:MAG: ribose-phosphate diphosphokinase [Deltaproteobacteria bacterium]|nr:ribose-phosphate diphosphokinase [Deltaproteobacteria bacterium]